MDRTSLRDVDWAWKGSQGGRAQPHLKGVRKRKGCTEWVDPCGPVSALLFPSSFNPQAFETPGVCALTLGWLCYSREEGMATKISTLSLGDCVKLPFSQFLLHRVCGIYLRGALQSSAKRV